MPELPEIESLRQKLAAQLPGKSIRKVTLRRADLRYPLATHLKTAFLHSPIREIRRRSKYLLIDFENDQTLVIHLGMSGRFFFTEPNGTLNVHDHVLFDLNDGRHLRFRDPRRFGMMILEATKTLSQNRFFNHLGVEPLTADFSAQKLYSFCHGSTAPIKSLLMNAKYVVGVGNIYANEALFLSGIRPTRIAKKITRAEAKLLCQNIKKILSESIQRGGTTFRDYVDLNQQPGLYQLRLFVYGRDSEPCRRCQKSIKRIVQTGRSSFYCTGCQK